MTKRIITGTFIFLAMLAGILLQGPFLRIMLLAAMLATMREMYRALRARGANPAAWTGYVYALLAAGLQAAQAVASTDITREPVASLSRFLILSGFSAPMLALTVGLLLGLTAVTLRGKVDFDSLSATIMPMVFPGVPFTLVMALQDLPNGVLVAAALLLTFFLASINDVFALFIGSRFGKHRLAPEISPKKSVEGAIAGVVSSVLFAMLVAWTLNRIQVYPFFQSIFGKADKEITGLPVVNFAVLGLAAGFMTNVGDLVASLIKRHCGIKDYGTILPGHGGIMDRFDGILFCGATCWLFFNLFYFTIV